MKLSSHEFLDTRSRGYLPHVEGAQVQAITYRLADALPQSVLQRVASQPADHARRAALEHYLDAGYGCCVLKIPAVAELLIENWRFFDGARYQLLAYVVMPNHVHVLIRIINEARLSKIVHSWKSYTAKRIIELDVGWPDANKKAVWQREYWDRYIRDDRHLRAVVDYIHLNPVKAGLVKNPEAWAWSSANAV